MEQRIRKVKKEDIQALKSVVDSSELFPSDLLDEMIHDYLTNSSSKDIWFTTTENGVPISMGYCAPERLTEGTYNLYAIAVHKDHQGKGVGKDMMKYIENLLRENGNRILIVETSGNPEFKLTRAFYNKCNYTKEATIREFYTEGEDKVVFWKKLDS
ncbi:GNAT family N-acetyltransferase [Fulvivirga sp. M361]|uniref:GNAT family N-acetyltransferase n=1 Tax=Fulvivirga sp. M361 TaxID=2594266 RepID=UPI00117AC5F9|nr:GNAT family N-acetyltransferase [Fulvivirga sp. M361]TRX58431.1 GNAT family N-acetyltransferase [Fulvivirga sp. M361]